MFTFIDALLDTVPAEAVAALWIDKRISASHETNGALEFISNESVEKLKRRWCHDSNFCVCSVWSTLYGLWSVLVACSLLFLRCGGH